MEIDENAMAENNAALDAAVAQALQQKRLVFDKKFRDGYQILKKLEEVDNNTESRIKAINKKAARSCLMSLGAFICAIIAGSVFESEIAVIICVAIIALMLILTIAIKIKGRIVGRNDLPDYFKDSLLPVLDMLQEDINQKAKVKFDLDFSPGNLKSKIVGKEKLPPGSNRKLIKTTYHNPWCKVQLGLTNGSIIRLDMTSHLFSFDRHYKTYRGKYKHKRKWKVIVEVTAILFPDKDRLRVDIDSVAQAAQSFKIKPGTKGDQGFIKHVRKFKFKVNAPFEIPDHTVKVDDIMEILITLCKSTTKAERV